jgi:DNA helicase-2/ATP-dependent DNA helicase PcrA
MNQDLNRFIETQLNEHQQQAVLQKDGCLLVIAGAGSGKTRVITSRIAHLMVNEHVDANAIVALTFTNKAAKEMQERIEKFLHGRSELPFIGTFHSYCLRLCKTDHLSNIIFEKSGGESRTTKNLFCSEPFIARVLPSV